jgi:hypothetical protein
MPTPVLYSGTSGRIVILGTPGGELAVGTYTFDKTASLADIGNSTSGGFELSKRIRRGGKLTATVLWDSGAIPETVGIDSGDEFTADLYIGESGKYYHSVPLISESLSVLGCTQDNVVTYQLTARANGTIPDPTSAP